MAHLSAYPYYAGLPSFYIVAFSLYFLTHIIFNDNNEVIIVYKMKTILLILLRTAFNKGLISRGNVPTTWHIYHTKDKSSSVNGRWECVVLDLKESTCSKHMQHTVEEKDCGHKAAWCTQVIH